MRPALSQSLFTALFSVWLAVFSAGVAHAAPNTAEAFVSDNVHAGLTILNDKQLTADERSAKFETLLLGVTDLKRIAVFTLGTYAAGAPPADHAAFVAAFQNYAVAVYRSYFQKYSGQALNVTGSRERAPGDFIVITRLTDPLGGGQPLEIDFRVNMSGPKPVINDLGVAGLWLVPAQRDDFGGSQPNKGDVAALTVHLNQVAQNFHG